MASTRGSGRDRQDPRLASAAEYFARLDPGRPSGAAKLAFSSRELSRDRRSHDATVETCVAELGAVRLAILSRIIRIIPMGQFAEPVMLRAAAKTPAMQRQQWTPAATFFLCIALYGSRGGAAARSSRSTARSRA